MRKSPLILAVLSTLAAAPDSAFTRIVSRTTQVAAMSRTVRVERPAEAMTPEGVRELKRGTLVHAFRRLLGKSEPYVLVVSENGEALGLVAESTLAATTASVQASSLVETPYGATLKSLTELSDPTIKGKQRRGETKAYLENAGLTSARRDTIAVTIDLCPTTARFESRLFQTLSDIGKARGRVVPATVFVSGRWLKQSSARRAKELKELVNWKSSPNLSLTFGNHSFQHPYRKRPVDQDFLLSRGIDLESEIMKTDLALLQHGFLPSPYFRFPGLISTDALTRDTAKLGDVVFGAGSWPGSGDAIDLGDIVLVHGNGREPLGVEKLLSWLRSQKSKLVSGATEILDLGSVLRTPK